MEPTAELEQQTEQTTALERPERVDPPSRGSPGPSLTGPTNQSVRASAAAAIEQDESGRMRVFSLVLFGIIVVGIAAIVALGGDRTVQAVHIAGAAIGGCGALWSYLRLRQGKPYTAFHNTVFGLTAITAITSGYFYWGVFSALLLLLPFGAFIFSTHRSFASALTVSATAFALHFIVALITIYEVVPDRGLFRPHGLGKSDQLLVAFVLQGIFGAVFLIARGAHKSTQEAVEELRRAVRALSLRDQLLSEAQEELSRALMIGGAGKYTGSQLGAYRLGEVLGRGAMGEVYDATNVLDGSEAAVKVLHPEVLASPQHVLRFTRELELIATIDSPHVVKVLQVGSFEDGLPFLAMERLRGQVLSQYLQDHGRMDINDVVNLVRDVGRGLQAAHAQGILHRDIKPQNLFRTEDGAWTVLDFGIAKLLDADATMTHGKVIGTPAYMSPEQARGEQLQRESDLYSLGVVAYRALVGRAPIAGGKAADVLRRVATTRPRRPQGIRNHAGDVEAVLAIALAERPADRFPDGETFAAALAKAATGQLSDRLRRRAIGLDSFSD